MSMLDRLYTLFDELCVKNGELRWDHAAAAASAAAGSRFLPARTRAYRISQPVPSSLLSAGLFKVETIGDAFMARLIQNT
jgi:hypothetical protein